MQLAKSGFRTVAFNVENLFVYLDESAPLQIDSLSEGKWQSLSRSTVPNKPIADLRALAKSIHEMQPDILMLSEVGGLESLNNFNRHFLQEKFRVFLLEGNSDRGIDIGYLVRADLPYKYDLISHKNRALDFLYPHERQSKATGYDELVKRSTHKFSRDVLELRIFQPENSRPSLILLLVHLKSPLDKERIDPQGRDRRKAELEKLIGIYEEIDRENHSQVPILIGGDFNGIAALPSPEAEFSAIYQRTKLQDVLQLVEAPLEQRYTYLQIHGGNVRPRQIDYIFVSPHLQGQLIRKECLIYRFQDEYGMPMLVPRTMDEKHLLCSDHYPVVATFNWP